MCLHSNEYEPKRNKYSALSPLTTVVVIGYEMTMISVREDMGPAQLCVSFMIPPSLDQVDDLQVFLNTATNPGTAGMLRLHHYLA